MIQFDRRYVLIPVLASVALVAIAFFTIEVGRAQMFETLQAIQRSQERLRLLTEVQLVIADAEAGQRGYILTGDESYLAPYEQAKHTVTGLLTTLNESYSDPAQSEQLPLATQIIQLSSAKLQELESAIGLYRRENNQSLEQALTLVRANMGQATMTSLRKVVADMRTQERTFSATETDRWLQARAVNRTISAAGAALNIFLIVLAGYLVSKGLQRRNVIASDLKEQINKKTQELSNLSTHLQRVSETEKSNLARELHDDLGGLLVGIKMDLAQLRSKIDLEQPDVKKRWDRIQSLLSSGIDLKRRVIEQLRPSLLDNMGVVAAVHWQVGEICGAAGLELVEHYPETEPELMSDAAIAIFRIAQESLTNVVKHAGATRVLVDMEINEKYFKLTVEDNGVGLPIDRWSAEGAHGIAGMRHRLLSFDGELVIEKADTAHDPAGTRLRVVIPLSRISTVATQAPHGC